MKHPKEILSSGEITNIRAYTSQTEAARHLPEAILSIIYNQKWFHVLVPQSCGGKELSLPETVQLFEALAWADANVGWCVNLGAGANMFAGYFDAHTALDIFEPKETCCAGSGAVSGKATRTEGGYTVSGRWKYASGANHATHFTANAWLLDETGQSLTEEGQPIFRSFIFPAKDITNHNNWNAIGLKATSSNDFEASNVFVPEAHTFSLLKPSTFAQGTIYKFPFAQLAVVNMACMMTGITLHFIDLYDELSAVKKPLHSDKLLGENETAKHIVNTATHSFYTARKKMYHDLQQVWDEIMKNGVANAALLEQLSASAKEAAHTARNVINELYPLCGMSILEPESMLNKVWRDAATASQHYLLSPLNN